MPSYSSFKLRLSQLSNLCKVRAQVLPRAATPTQGATRPRFHNDASQRCSQCTAAPFRATFHNKQPPCSRHLSRLDFCFAFVLVPSRHSFCAALGFFSRRRWEKILFLSTIRSSFLRPCSKFSGANSVPRSRSLICVFWCHSFRPVFSALLPRMLAKNCLLAGSGSLRLFLVTFFVWPSVLSPVLSSVLSFVLICSFWVESAAGALEAVSQFVSLREFWGFAKIDPKSVAICDCDF